MKSAASSWARFKFPALAATLAGTGLLLAFFGPSLALRLYLDLILPRQTGLTVSYSRADLKNRDLFLKNLTLTGPELGRLTCDLELRDIQNLIWSRPGLDLADSLALHDILWERESGIFSTPRIDVLRPRWPEGETDLPFSLLIAHNIRGQGFPDDPRFQAKRLALGNPDLTVEDLAFKFTTEAGSAWTGEVKSLKLDDFKSALDRWIQSGGRPLGLLPELFHLRVVSGRLDLEDQPVLLVKTAFAEPRRLFTKFSPDAVSYSYFLELWLDPAPLSGAFPPGLSGPPLDFELALDLTFDPQGRALELRSLSLDEPNLGRLDLAAELSGLGPGGYLAPELLAALFPARLHSLSLAFQDQGVMAGLYDWLALREGWDEAETPARLKAELLAPLAEGLAEGEGFSSLSALAKEAQAFLEQPENLIISVEPVRPLSLVRLVKRDRYDIIGELGLTLTVNDRPPVAAASGLLLEPRPPASFQADYSPPNQPPGRDPAE